MAKNDTKAEDSAGIPPVLTVDSTVLVSEVPESLTIESQEDAEQWVKSNGLKEAMVTSDKGLFNIENADDARNHAIYNRLKIFTVKI